MQGIDCQPWCTCVFYALRCQTPVTMRPVFGCMKVAASAINTLVQLVCIRQWVGVALRGSHSASALGLGKGVKGDCEHDDDPDNDLLNIR